MTFKPNLSEKSMKIAKRLGDAMARLTATNQQTDKYSISSEAQQSTFRPQINSKS